MADGRSMTTYTAYLPGNWVGKDFDMRQRNLCCVRLLAQEAAGANFRLLHEPITYECDESTPEALIIPAYGNDLIQGVIRSTYRESERIGPPYRTREWNQGMFSVITGNSLDLAALVQYQRERLCRSIREAIEIGWWGEARRAADSMFTLILSRYHMWREEIPYAAGHEFFALKYILTIQSGGCLELFAEQIEGHYREIIRTRGAGFGYDLPGYSSFSPDIPRMARTIRLEIEDLVDELLVDLFPEETTTSY